MMNELITSGAETKRREASSPLNFDCLDDMLLEGNLDTFLTRSGNYESSVFADSNLPDSTPLSPTGDPVSIVEKTEEKANNSKRKLSLQTTRRKKKPKGMPKRPLSAYNLYFQSQRAEVLARAETENDGKKIGFEGLGKIIGKQWRELSENDRKDYDKLAEKESVRYRKEMEEYNLKKSKTLEKDEKDKLGPSVGTQSEPNQTSLVAESQLPSLGTFQQGQFVSGGAQQVATSEEDDIHFPQPLLAQSFLSTTVAPYETSSPVAVDLTSRNQVTHQPFGAQQRLSFPPPPPGMKASDCNNILLPPGMEITLSDRNGKDRKYCIEYKCYSMPREEAQNYIESVTGAISTGQHQEMRESI